MKILIIRLLEACNAGCFMCDFARSRNEYRFTVDDAHAICEELAQTDCRLVRFTGGEPLMVDDLEDILRQFSSSGYLTSLITNGWYLPSKGLLLSSVGLSQVIVSMDGSTAATHDRFRQLPGLFEHCVAGIRSLTAYAPDMLIRVNTVVGPHNLRELGQLYELLTDLGVHQWSIIPLKRPNGSWGYSSLDVLKKEYEAFQQKIVVGSGPRLLGHSSCWAGRNENELEQFFRSRRNITPHGLCSLVDVVRYYTPRDGIVYPCNCVPHRLGALSLGETRTPTSWSEFGLLDSRAWLREHGPDFCGGCEPVNAALGEGLINLDSDPLGF